MMRSRHLIQAHPAVGLFGVQQCRHGKLGGDTVVERGVEVVLTRRGHPIARILPIEPEVDDLDRWLDEITADPHDSGLLAEIERLRRDEDDTDDRRLGRT